MSSLPLTRPQSGALSASTSRPVSSIASPILRKVPDGLQPLDLSGGPEDSSGSHKISAYARLDFDNYTFFVQTLQVVLGRKANDELLPSAHHSVDVHLSSKKAISRRHAKIFYNFGTQRFEISVLGRNGAFVDDLFIEKGITVHLVDGTRIQIGDIPFTFVLPSIEPTDSEDKRPSSTKFFNPTEALNLRTNLYLSSHLPPSNKKKLIAFSVSPKVESKDKSKSLTGRRSSKADIVRRLSVARQKSLASSSNDEISALLKELEAFRDEDIVEDAIFDPDLVADGSRNPLSASDLTYQQIQKQEDEIDRLVKQHNLTQGVDLDSDSSFSKNADLDVLDQEVASLAPLIDAQQSQNQTLMQKDIDNKFQTLPPVYSVAKSGFGEALRSGPLMGKPVGPRMGKPAPIPPPVYGRPAIAHMGSATATAQMSSYGLPAPSYGSYGGYNSMMRPPPPKLEVAVDTITSVPIRRPIVPFKAITIEVSDFEKAPICVFKTTDIISSTPKIPRRRKDIVYRRPAKVQNYKEIPDQFKTKPALSVLAMVSVVLRNKPNSSNGQSFNDILDNIRELFPYYKYCPDGWQFAVSHGIKFNPMFVSLLRNGPDSEWIWALDEKYIEERESRRKKLQELAVAKAKESALRAVEYRQRQNFSPYSSMGRPGIPTAAGQMSQTTAPGFQGQRPGEYAHASDTGKGGPHSYVTSPTLMLKPVQDMGYQKLEKSEGSIKDQLAANRARVSPAVPVAQVSKVTHATPAKATLGASLPTMNQDTKKSLTYLQKELFTLYKARELSYNTAITTEIITKALATTIAQVNIIGAKAGCGDNALSFLVDKAPQQVSKILDIALTKSIKEYQATALTQASRAASPAVSSPDTSRNTKEDAKMSSGPSLGKPLGVGGGLGRPSFGGPKDFVAQKSGGIRPPQFYSNKPLAPEKRLSESEQSNVAKAIKLEE